MKRSRQKRRLDQRAVAALQAQPVPFTGKRTALPRFLRRRGAKSTDEAIMASVGRLCAKGHVTLSTARDGIAVELA